jgi:type VII secretion integral membrane protein EccD
VNRLGPPDRADGVGQTSTAEVCRLLVIGPTSQVELSVPTHVPLSDLMPALLRNLGPDLADRGLEHGGWVVQPPGEAPLDEDLSVTDHGLLDGDTLHVRPRSDQIPPLDFDDLIDGVATGIRARSGLWRPRTTRTASALALVAWLVVALLVPLLDVAPVPAAGTETARAAAAAGAGGGLSGRAVMAGAVALLLLALAAVAGRLARDRVVAALFGGGTVALAAEAAVLAVVDAGPAPGAAGVHRHAAGGVAGQLQHLVEGELVGVDLDDMVLAIVVLGRRGESGRGQRHFVLVGVDLRRVVRPGRVAGRVGKRQQGVPGRHVDGEDDVVRGSAAVRGPVLDRLKVKRGR